MSGPAKPRTKRAVWVSAVLVVAGVLGVSAWREVQAGAAGVDAADAASEKKDWPSAIAAAREAAEAVVPGSPFPARGYARLEALAHDAEARGDDATAAEAFRAMRAAAMATRGFGAKTAEWLDRANAGIARVATHGKDAPRTDDHSAEDAMLAKLKKDERPATTTFALLAVGALAFFGGMARIAWAAGEPLSWKSVRWGLVAAVVGLAMYVGVCLYA